MSVNIANRKKYVADFETLVNLLLTYVWAWAICDCDNINDVKYGTSIVSFFAYLKTLKSGSIIYFHNLKFDGQFLVYYMLKHGFKEVQSNKKMPERSYTCLVSEIGQWYSIQVKLNGKNYIIYDSFKKIPMKVEQIAKALGLPEEKGKIDYKSYREEGGELSEEDKDYIRRDVQIVAQGLNELFFKRGEYKMTLSGDCMAYYKSITPKFDEWFPVLDPEVDKFCRDSYGGGISWCNPKYQGKLLQVDGMTVDCNSMHPSQMNSKVSGNFFPYGVPEHYDGLYEYDETYPLYIQRFKAAFKVYDGHMPTVQIKGVSYFNEHEFIKEVKEPIELTMTSVDLELFFEQYDVFVFIPIDGYKFRQIKYIFDDYVNYWYKEKEEASKSGDKVRKQVAKLHLNSLYGKFGTSTSANRLSYCIKDDDTLGTNDPIEKTKDGVFVPVASYITAYSRRTLVHAVQANYSNVCYVDTDSMHLIGHEVKGIELHDTKLGAWKIESYWTEAKFLRQKTYAEKINGQWEIKGCGMNEEVKLNITDIEDFHIGAVFPGKKTTKRVPGGVVIVDTTFKIISLDSKKPKKPKKPKKKTPAK